MNKKTNKERKKEDGWISIGSKGLRIKRSIRIKRLKDDENV